MCATRTKKDADDQPTTVGFHSYLKYLTKMVGPASEVCFTPHSKGTRLSIQGLGCVASTIVPLRISDRSDYAFFLQISAAEAAFSARASRQEVTLDESALVVKNDKTRFTLLTEGVSAVPRVETPREDYSAVEMDPELWTFLNEALPLLRLEKISSSQPDPRLFVSATDSKLFVVAYDSFQMAFVARKNTSAARCEFNVPLPRLTSVLKDTPDAATCRLYIGEDTLIVKSGAFSASYLTAPLLDNEPSGEVVRERAQGISKEVEYWFTIQLADLTDILSSFRAVAQDDTKLVFKTTSKGFTIEANSSFGSSKATISTKDKPEVEITFALELKFLKNMATKARESITLGLAGNALIARTDGLVSYVTVTSDL